MRDAARIRVLDDRDGRAALRVELGDELVSRVGIVEIVVGEFLALQLRRGRDAEAPLGRAVERRRLMRVLAIAKRLGERAGDKRVAGFGSPSSVSANQLTIAAS